VTLETIAHFLSRSRSALKIVVPAALVTALFLVPGMASAGGGGKPRRDRSAPTLAVSGVQQTTASALVVSGTASDNVGVTQVEVSVDGGAYQAAQGTTSWSFTVDTSKLAAGSHTATARALDAAGNSAAASVVFPVSGPADTTPPTASIAAPTANSSVSGTVTVAGTASDDTQVAKVELSVDGGPYQAAQGTASWSAAVDTSGYPNGSHTLKARATDPSGNVGLTSETVVVSNDLAPPSVAVTAPAAGATVSGSVPVSGTAADDVSLAKVELSVDGGGYQAAQGTTSWTSTVDSTKLANGSHTLTARATDGAGKTSTAAVTVSVSNSTPSGGGSQLVTPEGVKIDVASDVTGWTAQQVYDLLKANAYELNRIGPTLTVKVQTQYASVTSTGVSEVGGVYQNYRATIYLDARPGMVLADRPDYVMAHEYGHAWSTFHLYMSQRGDWSSWLTFRGLAGDPRLDSSFTWDRSELIADDYRMLFGSPAAVSEASYINVNVPDPRTVAGLRDFFVNAWAVP
jgi:hypothetical protein